MFIYLLNKLKRHYEKPVYDLEKQCLVTNPVKRLWLLCLSRKIKNLSNCFSDELSQNYPYT